MKEKTETWIRYGYEAFAMGGKNGLNIEQIARSVGKSKSSFYHHFVDTAVFMEALLNHHLLQSKCIAEKERKATSIQPELIQILLDHQMDLLFNRQLRIHADHAQFKSTLRTSTQIIGTSFIELWMSSTHLPLSVTQVEGIFELALENFFLQINPQNLTKEWLTSYFENLNRITRNLVV